MKLYNTEKNYKKVRNKYGKTQSQTAVTLVLIDCHVFLSDCRLLASHRAPCRAVLLTAQLATERKQTVLLPPACPALVRQDTHLYKVKSLAPSYVKFGSVRFE